MKTIFLVTCLGAALCSAALQAETISISNWTPEFQGIDYASGTIVDNGNTSVAYGLRIDLAAPGIRFTTTPPGGSLNTVSETTTQFLEKTGASGHQRQLLCALLPSWAAGQDSNRLGRFKRHLGGAP
jgi:hypothetical protein